MNTRLLTSVFAAFVVTLSGCDVDQGPLLVEDPAVRDAAMKGGNGGGGPGSGESHSLDFTFVDGLGGISSDGQPTYLDAEADVVGLVTDRQQVRLATTGKKKNDPVDRLVHIRVTDTGGVVFAGDVDISAQTKDLVDVTTLTIGVPTLIPFRVVFRFDDVLYRLRYGRLCYHETPSGTPAEQTVVPDEQATITATEAVDGTIVAWKLESAGVQGRLCVVPPRNGGDPFKIPDVTAEFEWTIRRVGF